MLQKIKNKIPYELKWKIEKKYKTFFDLYGEKFYSFEGEDAIVKALLNHRGFVGPGFYVDIGANHPLRFSNTHYFYKKGWKGINIDANPGSMKIFNKVRKRDINLEVAISENEMELDFHVFNEDCISSFDKDLSEIRMEKHSKYKIVETIKMKTRTLKSILDEFMPENTEINFMSIDTEGHDLQVLKSNDWMNYSPEIILVEENNTDIVEVMNGSTYKYVVEQGYSLFSKTFNTLIFVRS